jgi:hypothetical protein
VDPLFVVWLIGSFNEAINPRKLHMICGESAVWMKGMVDPESRKTPKISGFEKWLLR